MHQSHWNKNLIQLRQYRRGDALKSIEGLEYMEIKQLKSAQRKSMRTLTENSAFYSQAGKLKPIQNETPRQTEKFVDLLDIAVTNLREAKREYSLGHGTFHRKLLRKLIQKGW